MFDLNRWLRYMVHGERAKRRSPRRPRRGPSRDWRYRQWIRTQPSIASGQMGCEAAHTGNDGGMRQKSSDYTCVPLTPSEHRQYHRIGRRAFEMLRGIDLDVVVESLTTEYWSRRAA